MQHLASYYKLHLMNPYEARSGNYVSHISYNIYINLFCSSVDLNITERFLIVNWFLARKSVISMYVTIRPVK